MSGWARTSAGSVELRLACPLTGVRRSVSAFGFDLTRLFPELRTPNSDF